MPLGTAPPQIRHTEEHHEYNTMRSIRAPSDRVPFLERADVLFAGSAYSPGGTKSGALSVRLSLGRTDGEQIWAVLDKELLVRGKRSPENPNESLPFDRMPIVYEKAFGGIGHTSNPMGTTNPNIIYMTAGAHEIPAGFGPISSHWPTRKRLLKGYSRQIFDQPIIELPADFDAAYFQSAPEDQRIERLMGDEIILLENLNPSHPDLEMRLPGARALYRVVTSAGMSRPVALHPDTLFIDGDAQLCTLTYRGYFPLYSEDAIPSLSVIAGIELEENSIRWDDELTAARDAALQEEATIRRPTSDFKKLAEQTLTMVDGETDDFATNPLSLPDFPLTPHKAASKAEDPRAGTLILTEPSKAPLTAPFPLPPPSQSPSQPPPAPIPGAPWAASADPRRAPKPPAPNLESTLSLLHSMPSPAAEKPKAAPAAPPPPIAEIPKAPEAPPPPKEPAKPAWSWAPSPSDDPPPAAQKTSPDSKKPVPPPRKSLKDKLYGTGDRNTKK